MSKFHKYLSLAFIAIFTLVWVILIGPSLLKLNTSAKYDANVVSIDNFYDANNKEFLGEQHSKTIYNFSVTGKKGKLLQITNIFDVKSLDGKQIFKVSPTYVVDPYSRIGSNPSLPSQTAYVFPPKGLKEGQGFNYWHVTSKNVIPMKYAGKEKIRGLTVYRYEKKDLLPNDQSELLDFLPDVPERKGIKLVSNIYIWVEPISGYLVKLEDFSTDYYYYDIKTGERLYPYNQFLNTYSQDSLNEFVKNAKFEKYKHITVLWLVPLVLLLTSLIIFFIEKVITSNKFIYLQKHFKIISLTSVILLAFGYLSYLQYQNNIKIRNIYFEDRVREANIILNKQLDIYIGAILGGKGLFEASDRVDHNEWKSYIKSINLEKNYPGTLGLGYSAVFSASEAAQFISEQRKSLGNNFNVYPDGKRNTYSSITYLEPQNEKNKKAIGFDMYTESTRRSAMNKATSSKALSMSGKVTLVQEIDSDIQPGFLIYNPIFTNNKLTGFVYSPFQVRDLINSIFENLKTDLTFKIYDGLKMLPDNLLYDRNPNANSSEIFKKVTTIYIAGHPWTIEYKNSPDYKENFVYYLFPFLIFIFGLLISSLLWVVLYTNSISEEKATAFSKQANQDLEVSRQKLIEKNKELEEKVKEANILNNLMVGRELKMIELKRKIEQPHE